MTTRAACLPAIPMFGLVLSLALTGCVTPSAYGIRTDGRLPMHSGLIELGVGGMALGSVSEPYPLVTPSFTWHLERVSFATNVHVLPTMIAQTGNVPAALVISGEARIRVWEQDLEGMGVALLFGGGLPPGFTGYGFDTGAVVSSPRKWGLRAYGGARFNTVIPFGDEIEIRGAQIPNEPLLFGTAAAGFT